MSRDPLDPGGLVTGWHAVGARLRAGGVRELWLDADRRDRRAQALRDQARAAGVEIRLRSGRELDAAAPGLRHQGVLAWFDSRTAPASLSECLAAAEQPLVLVLDGVEDPRNLGACLRSADGAGADAVVIPGRRAAPLTSVARRTAAGAAESLPLFSEANLSRALQALQSAGLWVIGLGDAAERTLYEIDLDRPLALVLGNEGQGLRKLTAERCDELASLPMAGSVSSLNVSVATGVALYEVLRQRRYR